MVSEIESVHRCYVTFCDIFDRPYCFDRLMMVTYSKVGGAESDEDYSTAGATKQEAQRYLELKNYKVVYSNMVDSVEFMIFLKVSKMR